MMTKTFVFVLALKRAGYSFGHCVIVWSKKVTARPTP